MKQNGANDKRMALTILRILIHPLLLLRGFRCILIIFNNFFLFQFRAALFPGRIPVSRVEHVLDERIPFNPRFVRIYLDFVSFWVRVVEFLCVRYGKEGVVLAADFIDSIAELYPAAMEIYAKNLSTTRRPRRREFRFRIIHLFDPHLMCIPSLHVMIVIRTYTKLRGYVRSMGEEEILRPLTEKIFQGALVITDAVLYIKQHSINCIAAALYCMNRLDPDGFSTADAEDFVYGLFRTEALDIPPEYAPFYGEPLIRSGDVAWLREHIISLYRMFLESGEADWTKPILDYLNYLPHNGLS
ncbi:MAG: hypothetical protein LBK77_09875 [Spirochaetaceae bacterium]|nr:hypothetical protein [Spirochaetaceae bacterium]